jgi:hypothetical protein
MRQVMICDWSTWPGRMVTGHRSEPSWHPASRRRSRISALRLTSGHGKGTGPRRTPGWASSSPQPGGVGGSGLDGRAALAWGGHAAWDAIQTWGTPTCSWPLQVRGTASPAQAGLVRCYLRALASRDTAGLMAVAADIPPVRITNADLKYSADARAGLATATFTPNPNDTTFASVTIAYADGVHDNASMMNMIAMGGPSGWRMDIGAVINPGSGPPPAS